MLARVAQVFRQAPETPPLGDAAEIERRYRKLRNDVLFGSMAVYAFSTLPEEHLGRAAAAPV